MDGRLLRKFDRIIKVLNQSREEYQQEHYLASHTLSEDAVSQLSLLEDSLRINVICCKEEEDADQSKLKGDEKARLIALNDILTELEKTISKEVKRIVKRYAPKRKEGVGDRMIHDYEIDVKVSFYLDENDPEYTDDRDNIMAEFCHPCIDKNGSRIDPTRDYNDLTPNYSNPLNFRPHCYTFHELYDHRVPKLTFRDLLRIGMICTEIIVLDQNFTYLADFPEYTGKHHKTGLDSNRGPI